ncbi:MAG TPA: MobF family relaxase [Candidatus Tectomicrobia bacterium]
MVASISARGNAKAALAYYDHLRRDDYYTREGEPPGRWAGDAAVRLSLQGPVTQSEFDAALNGLDPKTGERLVQRGGHAHRHAAGWDMTFSAPKSVSVLWALSEPEERAAIEAAQRAAVMEATRYLEREAAWSRRGQCGKHQEQAACLLVAQFDHYTSREMDPQLHTHCFVFNLAPRKDGTWGAIVSRELYKAQKQAGAVYRSFLARGLEQHGHLVECQGDRFRIAAIPQHVDRAFSKRRRAIEEAARTYEYSSAKGMELVTLRTRQPKREAQLNDLFSNWQSEAAALGFVIESLSSRLKDPQAQPARQATHNVGNQVEYRAPALIATLSGFVSAATTGAQRITGALNSMGWPAAMPAVKFPIRHSKDHEREPD